MTFLVDLYKLFIIYKPVDGTQFECHHWHENVNKDYIFTLLLVIVSAFQHTFEQFNVVIINNNHIEWKPMFLLISQ